MLHEPCDEQMVGNNARQHDEGKKANGSVKAAKRASGRREDEVEYDVQSYGHIHVCGSLHERERPRAIMRHSPAGGVMRGRG